MTDEQRIAEIRARQAEYVALWNGGNLSQTSRRGQLILEDIPWLLARLEAAEAQARAREDLISHAWVHSGYIDCGYMQMTTEQKTLYCQVIGSDKAKHDEDHARYRRDHSSPPAAQQKARP